MRELRNWVIGAARRSLGPKFHQGGLPRRGRGNGAGFRCGALGVCTGETYKQRAERERVLHLEDPSRLFNSSLEGNVRRAIDIHEGEKINEKALKALIVLWRRNMLKRATACPVRSQKKPKNA